MKQFFFKYSVLYNLIFQHTITFCLETVVPENILLKDIDHDLFLKLLTACKTKRVRVLWPLCRVRVFNFLKNTRHEWYKYKLAR